MAENETTPLLADVGDNAPQNEHVPASAHFHQIIKNLTVVILVLSVLALLSLITEFFILTVWPFRWYVISDRQALLFIFFLIATIFSIIGLNVNVPVILNLIVDVILAFYLLSWTFSLIFPFPTPNLCLMAPGYPTPKDLNLDPNIPPPGCRSWELAVWILSGIASGLGGTVGLLYLVLVILRTIALFRTKFWSSSPGQVTFQVTFRIITQDNGDMAERGGTDAPSTSPHGVQGPVAGD